jgi:hypothetical protein
VSIRERFAASRHLDDDVLTELWSTAAIEGRTAAHPHLTACAHCRARYAALESWLEDVRVEARTEADEALTPERLAAQQAAILRRLEALERPARVIAFPRRSAPVSPARHVTRRWVTTAAAAGLVIGLAAGQLLDLRHRLAAPGQPSGSGTLVTDATPARPPSAQPASLSVDEALFYGDDENALSARSARYMPAIDAITPRARDEFDRNR